MNQQEAFDRIVGSLHDTTFDDDQWAATSALIEDSCGSKGTSLVFGSGNSPEEIEIFFAQFCNQGKRYEDLEKEYFLTYHGCDERLPRIRRLPDSKVVHTASLYSEEEIKKSFIYNEYLVRVSNQNSLLVRLDGPNASRIVFCLWDPMDGESWSSSQVEMMERTLPHLRQFVAARQALLAAGALNETLSQMLDNTRFGVIQMDRQGRIVAANDRARKVLKKGDGLSDQGGILSALSPQDDADLKRLLARALPRFGGQGVGGSMMVRRSLVLPRLLLHIVPLGPQNVDFQAWRIAALVLVVDPADQTRVDPVLAAAILGLTAAESGVAVSLAEGRTISDIARITGRSEHTIRWHVKQIFNKLGISRQMDLTQLVLSLADIPVSLR